MIKLFKEYNILSDNKFYKKIDKPRWLSMDNIVNISHKSIKVIKSYFNDSNTVIGAHGGGTTDRYTYDYIKVYRPFRQIFELKDEWFILYDYSVDQHYLCDQIDGLEKLLKDIR